MFLFLLLLFLLCVLFPPAFFIGLWVMSYVWPFLAIAGLSYVISRMCEAS